ncbi:MAG TPA: PEP-CTERM sorting domain-containing protein [Candidatus Acidoferrales bacterium]
MKNILKGGALLVAFVFLAVLPAHADSGDTYQFDMSGPVTASWTMSENPTPYYYEEGTVFLVEAPDLVVDGVADGSDILCFFSLGDLGGLNSVNLLPDFFGQQVYSGDESAPTFTTGTYYFTMSGTNAIETLTIAQAPEPGTILLLCSGLAAIGLKRKRQAAN